jgi:hypothetical protein
MEKIERNYFFKNDLFLRVTFVQIVICIVSLIAYGISPVGFSFAAVKGLATTINLEKQLISYQVKQNFWIGPAVVSFFWLFLKVFFFKFIFVN